MTKIFISHASIDGHFAEKLMDLLQTQFSLTRENFFFTSDEELAVGENWIEQIREGMDRSSLILPIITPNFLASQFCLCELGATWVKKTSLFPIIIPPLKHNALDSTPFRSWMQSIILNSETDLQRLAEAIKNKGIGDFNSVRFTKRAKAFISEVLDPFQKEMESIEVVTAEEMKKLKIEIGEYEKALDGVEEELNRMKKENEALRQMKDTSEVKAFDLANLDEWDTFEEAVISVKKELKDLPPLIVSIMYHQRRPSRYRGFYSTEEDLSKLQVLESKGYVVFDDGWDPDYEHSAIQRADATLDKLDKVIKEVGDIIQEKFEEEYKDIRLSLSYSTFWEEVLGESILHSEI